MAGTTISDLITSAKETYVSSRDQFRQGSFNGIENSVRAQGLDLLMLYLFGEPEFVQQFSFPVPCTKTWEEKGLLSKLAEAQKSYEANLKSIGKKKEDISKFTDKLDQKKSADRIEQLLEKVSQQVDLAIHSEYKTVNFGQTSTEKEASGESLFYLLTGRAFSIDNFAAKPYWDTKSLIGSLDQALAILTKYSKATERYITKLEGKVTAIDNKEKEKPEEGHKPAVQRAQPATARTPATRQNNEGFGCGSILLIGIIAAGAIFLSRYFSAQRDSIVEPSSSYVSSTEESAPAPYVYHLKAVCPGQDIWLENGTLSAGCEQLTNDLEYMIIREQTWYSTPEVLTEGVKVLPEERIIITSTTELWVYNHMEAGIGSYELYLTFQDASG
ncbi:MAG: hypothetical protein HGA85_08950, partial [Nanoarchaeota archaeon]|nr:hypothetical protein [Nanoarchaeota archaeon]